MMFAPGDLVVCVDASPHRIVHLDESAITEIVNGGIYRVTGLANASNGLGLLLNGEAPHTCSCCDGPAAWRPTRFRKIDPLADLDTRAAGKTFRLPAKPVLDPARHSRELAK